MHPPRIIPAVRIRRNNTPPPHRFFAGLTAAAAALALVLAAALPARAETRNDDLAKALLGIIALGVIVNELDDNDRKASPAQRKKHKADRGRIPGECAIRIDGARRSVTVYSESCLRREGVRAALPRQCSHEARIYGKWDRIYGVDCLRDAGFDVREDRRSRRD